MSCTEALRDILTFLNRSEFRREEKTTAHFQATLPADALDETPLYIANNAVFAAYATLRMGSTFHPIRVFDQSHADAPFSGHEASLTLDCPAQAHAPTTSLSFENLAPWLADDQEVIYLDRLSRTLHTLNFLARGSAGDLHLNVHPQHLLAVHADHGRIFEQILAQCGLQPEQIVLEISEHAIRDKQRLKAAIAAWQSRRYRIAIDDFGVAHTQFVRVAGLRPDIIKFNGTFLAQQAGNPSSRRRLDEQVRRIHAENIRTIATGIDSAALYEYAQDTGFTAAQGLWLDNLSNPIRLDAENSGPETLFRSAATC